MWWDPTVVRFPVCPLPIVGIFSPHTLSPSSTLFLDERRKGLPAHPPGHPIRSTHQTDPHQTYPIRRTPSDVPHQTHPIRRISSDVPYQKHPNRHTPSDVPHWHTPSDRPLSDIPHQTHPIRHTPSDRPPPDTPHQTLYECSTHRDPVELELMEVRNHHESAGIQTQVLCKSSQCP